VVKKGKDPKAQITQMIVNDRPFLAAERTSARMLTDVMDIRLRDVIRDEKGGSYGVSTSVELSPLPYPAATVYVGFTCDLARQKDLAAAAQSTLAALAKGGVSDELVSKAREISIKALETEQKTNAFWADGLLSYLMMGLEPKDMATAIDRYRATTREQVQALATAVLTTGRTLSVTLVPEN
jgi:zinc protease